MKHILYSLLIAAAAVMAACGPQTTKAEIASSQAISFENCPVSLPAAGEFAPPEPFAPRPSVDEFWYGTSDLWTALPTSGRWEALPHNKAGYTQKLFWWREGYDALAEPQPDIIISGKRLDDPSQTFTEDQTTHGIHPNYQSFMLVGVDFPTEGCWEVTGSYRGRTLSYVVWVGGPNDS